MSKLECNRVENNGEVKGECDDDCDYCHSVDIFVFFAKGMILIKMFVSYSLL